MNTTKYGYSDEVVERYHDNRYIGSLDKDSIYVGTGIVGAPACGDVLKIQIEFDPKLKKINKVRYKAFGCMSAIAASAYAAERLEGETIEESLKITNNEISKHLSLPPIKRHCSMLAEEAIAAAVKDLRDKGAITDIEESDS